MNIEEFKIKYAAFKDAENIKIVCDHPLHDPPGEILIIGKQAAKRNIGKRGGKEFICRRCCMTHDNPMHKEHNGNRQAAGTITVYCPHPEHEGEPSREMPKSSYVGEMKEPYLQVCRSCSQRGHQVSEETKELIRLALTGIIRSDEFKAKLSEYMKNNTEGLERAKENLIPGIGGGWNKGLATPEDVKEKMSAAMLGREYTDEHCENISVGRKKMLEETGGFTREHREKLSQATIRQFQNGFDPKLHHISGWHSSPIAGRVFFRSSYEKKAYLKLDEDDTILTYKTEAISVGYFNPKKQITSNYLIDIHVFFKDGTQKLIEIKPEKWLLNNVVQAKVEAGTKFAAEINVPFEIWTEMELFGPVYNEKHIRNFVAKLKQELECNRIKEKLINEHLNKLQNNKQTLYFEVTDVFDDFCLAWTISELEGEIGKTIMCHTFEWHETSWVEESYCEFEGPAALTCPLKFFKYNNIKKGNKFPAWREEVVKYHEGSGPPAQTHEVGMKLMHELFDK